MHNNYAVYYYTTVKQQLDYTQSYPITPGLKQSPMQAGIVFNKCDRHSFIVYRMVYFPLGPEMEDETCLPL